MKKQSELIKERLKQVMLSDRIGGFETLLTVLKSDLVGLLSNYMSLQADAVGIVLDLEADGTYTFSLTARTDRLIEPGRMIIR